MYSQEEVEKIFNLHNKGWGKKRIAIALNMSCNTVRRYLHQKKWVPYQTPLRVKKLDKLKEWLKETFCKHKGNGSVVHQELIREHGICVDKSTVRKALKPLRKELEVAAKATVRFETPPGQQMQIDFGSMTVKINNTLTRVHFFVAVLGYSRRQYAQAFLHERQNAWFAGIEKAFHHFGGIPKEVLLDNAKALVSTHNPLTREVVFNDRQFNSEVRHCLCVKLLFKGSKQ